MRGEVPAPVRRHLNEQVIAPALLAWLRLADDGTIAEAELDHTLPLQVGDRAEDALPALVGMLPLFGRRVVLRSVAMGDAPPSDLHVFEEDGATWVLLVDESRRDAELRAWIQRANDEALRREQEEAVGERLVDVALGLELAVFEPLGGTALRLLSPPPPWLVAVRPQWQVGARGDARDLSDYLADYIECEVGSALPPGRPFLSSLPWTEEVEGLGPIVRECIAGRTASGRPFVAVRRLGLDFGDRVAPIQTGRNLGLGYERLAREIEEKEVLLHCVFHDLANPLGVVLNCLELLEGPLEGDDEVLRRTALAEAMRQRSITDALLDVFRQETRRGPDAAPGGVDVEEVLARLEPGLELVGEQRGVRVRVEPAPAVVRGEPIHLERILQNLVENAVRVSPPGTEVVVRVEAGRDVIRLQVDDEGPGIPEGMRSEVFDKLRTGRDGLGKLGLGLYFCRITARRWGGDVVYEARRPAGSRFEVRLPPA